MNVQKTIDWITASTSQLREPGEVLPHAAWGKMEHGILHYQCQKICSDSGARFLWSPDVTGRGACIVLSGGALLALRRFSQLPPDKLLPHLSHLGFLATRIDFALDLYDPGITIGDIYEQIMDGRITVPTRTVTRIQAHSGSATGETLYIGSRTSERYLRIYDKGVEQNSAPSGQWLRIELEVKGKRAKLAFVDLLRYGESACVANQLSSFITTAPKWFIDAICSEQTFPASILSRPVPARRKWLLGQVASAIANEIREDPDFWETLAVVVNDDLSVKNV